MRASVKDWAALVTAIAALVGVLSNALQTREVKADTRAQWDNLGEYTVPEIVKLQERVAVLERTCEGVKP